MSRPRITPAQPLLPTATACEPSPMVAELARTATVDPGTAFVFLGVKRDLGYRMLRCYRKRTGPLISSSRPVSLENVRPRRDKRGGEWIEIANTKVGGCVRCRTDLLIWQLHPECAPW